MEKRWSYQDSIKLANEALKEAGIPKVVMDGNADAELNFIDVLHASPEQLEKYLVIYGGFKGQLEQRVSDTETKRAAMEAQFTENYNIAYADLLSQVEGKKPTKDECRGIIMGSIEPLAKLQRELIDVTAIMNKLESQLRLYTQCWATVSRIVALRTKGID
tara:strand:+ start:1402 stop:1884 length:483 start_codon:yes stop_codon:yes gene_type:complete